MNLIWQIPSDFLDIDWIREILENIKLEEYFDGNYELAIDKSIVVYSSQYQYQKLKNYLKQLERNNIKYVLMHMSDEFNTDDWSYYSRSRLVLRTHWRKKYDYFDNIIVFPLGYTVGFRKVSKNLVKDDTLTRKYSISFVGDTSKSSRRNIRTEISKIDDFYVHETSSWDDPKALPKEAYKTILLESKFALCPRGFWNLDTFRVYEALECGAIPIVEKTPLDYFAKYFGKYPFLSYEKLEDAVDRVSDLLSREKELVKLQRECIDWWSKCKESVKKEIASRIDKAMRTNPRFVDVLKRKLIYRYVISSERLCRFIKKIFKKLKNSRELGRKYLAKGVYLK